jgi:hypothetical protein
MRAGELERVELTVDTVWEVATKKSDNVERAWTPRHVHVEPSPHPPPPHPPPSARSWLLLITDMATKAARLGEE